MTNPTTTQATETVITLNDDRFGDKQTFSSMPELDAAVTLCATEWYNSLTDNEQSLEDYIDECCREARRVAVVA